MSEYFVYVILSEETPNSLSKQVNKAMGDGFRINGSFVIDNNNYGGAYTQCLIKDCASQEEYQLMYDKWITNNE